MYWKTNSLWSKEGGILRISRSRPGRHRFGQNGAGGQKDQSGLSMHLVLLSEGCGCKED